MSEVDETGISVELETLLFEVFQRQVGDAPLMFGLLHKVIRLRVVVLLHQSL